MGRGCVFEETGDVLWGADTMRYAIRRLDADCWMDEAVFSSDDKLRGDDMARDAVTARIADGSIHVFAPSVFCVVEKLKNGRERLVGEVPIAVGRGLNA